MRNGDPNPTNHPTGANKPYEQFEFAERPGELGVGGNRMKVVYTEKVRCRVRAVLPGGHVDHAVLNAKSAHPWVPLRHVSGSSLTSATPMCGAHSSSVGSASSSATIFSFSFTRTSWAATPRALAIAFSFDDP